MVFRLVAKIKQKAWLRQNLVYISVKPRGSFW